MNSKSRKSLRKKSKASRPRSSKSKTLGKSRIQTTFAAQLRSAGMSASSYLSQARSKARAYGVASERLDFSDDKKHKLMITDDEGRIVRFGAVGYGDYILYKKLESNGDVEKGTAEKKRAAFQNSHRAIGGNWKKKKYSANNLALNILW